MSSLLIISIAVQSIALDPIVVEATRIEQDSNEVPASISVVELSETAQSYQKLGLDEFLSTVPGVFFQSRYNFAQDLRISIRGFGARSSFGVRGIRFLVDDVPETLPDGQTQLDAIDLADIDSIEVLRGASSALYGNASGGVIRLKTIDISDLPRFSFSQQLGAFDFNQTRLGFSARANKHDFAFSLRRLELEGYRDHAATESIGFNTKWRYDSGDGVLNISFSGIDSPESQDPGGITAEDVRANRRQARVQNVLFDAGEDVTQQRLTVSYDHSLADEALLTMNAYATQRDFQNRLPFEAAGMVDLDRFIAGIGLQYSDDSFLSKATEGRFVVGFNAELQRDERKRFDNLQGLRGNLALDQEERVSSLGVYAHQVIQPTEKTALTLGVRYDNSSFEVNQRPLIGQLDESGRIDFDEISYFTGATYSLSDRHKVFVNLSSSFETPTTTELADPDGIGFNQALQPQMAINAELGLKGQFDQASSYAISVYVIESDDELIPFELDSQPGRVFFQNAGETRRSGIELEWNHQLGQYWCIKSSYSYANNRFTEFVLDNESLNGNQLPGIPQQQFALNVVYQNSDWLVGGDFRAVGQRYVNNANTVAAAGYGVVDLRFAYTLKETNIQYEIVAGINNVFDKEYIGNIRVNAFGGRFFEPDPERNAYLGLKLSWD